MSPTVGSQLFQNRQFEREWDTKGLERAQKINSGLLAEEKECQILKTGGDKQKEKEEGKRKESLVGNFTENQITPRFNLKEITKIAAT